MPADLLADIHAAGHEGHSVEGEGLRGAPDPVILEIAKSEGRVLLTLDKEIGDIRKYPPGDYPGIVLFRPRKLGPRTVLAFVRSYLPGLFEIDLPGRLITIRDAGVRIRQR